MHEESRYYLEKSSLLWYGYSYIIWYTDGIRRFSGAQLIRSQVLFTPRVHYGSHAIAGSLTDWAQN